MRSIAPESTSRRGSAQCEAGRVPSHTLASRVRNFANMSKPHVEIQFDGDSQNVYVSTYSTLDKIEGSVMVTAPHDTPFDDVDISLIGTTKTYVENMGSVSAINSRNEAFHQFLQLTQPMLEENFPSPRVLEAGLPQKFPFTFVVPNQLLLSSCRHKTVNDKLKDAHLQLPPSMGDPDLAGTGGTLLDDLCPDMVRITYCIRVRIIRNKQRDGGELREQTIADRTRKIRVIPAVEEQPPIEFDEKEDEYCQRKEKAIRKGIFKAKCGRLAMETTQPQSLRLKHPSATDGCPISSMAKIMLRFDPLEDGATPPRLGSLVSKLKIATYHASSPRSRIPIKNHATFDATQGLFVEALPLSTRNMGSVQWHKHGPREASPEARRDSVISTESVTAPPKPTETYQTGKPYYTAQILVPITLPKNKAFVPTFHSCLASRIYVLDMGLAVQGSTASGVGTTLNLKVPIQVSSELSAEATRQLEHASPSYEEAMGYSSASEDNATARSNSSDSQVAVVPPPRDEYHTEYTQGHQSANPDRQFEWRGDNDDDDPTAYRLPATAMAANLAADSEAPHLPPNYGNAAAHQPRAGYAPPRRSTLGNFRNSLARFEAGFSTIPR